MNFAMENTTNLKTKDDLNNNEDFHFTSSDKDVGCISNEEIDCTMYIQPKELEATNLIECESQEPSPTATHLQTEHETSADAVHANVNTLKQNDRTSWQDLKSEDREVGMLQRNNCDAMNLAQNGQVMDCTIDGMLAKQSDLVCEDSLGRLNEELAKRRPDPFVIRQHWEKISLITDDIRYKVWQALLGVDNLNNQTPNQSIPKVEGDLDNQRVITVDAERTRGKVPYFKKRETIDMVANLLTYYCKCRSIRYKQGMNEVLAPFIMLVEPPLPDGVIFNLFYALISKFLPNIYSDNEFRSLQCSFRLFRLLLLYHDPQLCHALDQNDMSPELYATPWFMTLFARNLERDLLFTLWDFFILNNDPFLLHFVSYALISSRREKLLSADAATLPETLTSICFDSVEHVQDICKKSFEIMSHTPRSFLRDLYTACYAPVTDATIPILHHLETSSCLSVSTCELVGQLTRSQDDADINQNCGNLIKFFVLDCRPLHEYEHCHLSLSYHMDPDILVSPDALNNVMEGFSKMKGCHFCFVGSDFDASQQKSRRYSRSSDGTIQVGKEENLCVTRFVLLLLQKGFEYVSKTEDGFSTILKAIENLDPYVQDQVLVREPRREKESGFKSRAKRAANGFIERMRSSSNEVETELGSGRTPKIAARVGQTFNSLKSAAKEAVTVVRRSSSSNSDISVSRDDFAFTDHTVEDEEWIEISESAKSRSEKARELKEVILGEGHLGILFKGVRGEELQTVVDSVIPGSAAALTGSIVRGDILRAVNGRDVTGIPFKESMAILKGSPRPLVLRFQLPKPKIINDIDAICRPLNPPILVGNTSESLSIMWDRRSGGTRYQLQYAKRSDYYFNPWQSIGIVDAADESTPAVTSGTVTGLEPESSYVFRVRCGTAECWGSYSLSSSAMTTLSSTGDNTSVKPLDPIGEIRKESVNPASLPTVQFLPGVCPESREEGCFFYRVLVGCAARATPEFEGERLDRSLDYGTVIKCCERFNRPGSSQVFVRLWDGDAWGFESTPDGAPVLERLPDYDEENAFEKIKGKLDSTGLTNFMSATRIIAPEPPTVHACSPISLLVSWLPLEDPNNSIVRYQVIYTKASTVGLWTAIDEIFDNATSSCTIEGLEPQTSYIVRLRAGTKDSWSPYSSSSIPATTLEAETDDSTEVLSPRNAKMDALKQKYSAATSFLGKAVAKVSKQLPRSTSFSADTESKDMAAEEELIDIEEWKSSNDKNGTDMHFFQGKKLADNGELVLCHIIITTGYFISAIDSPSKPGWAVIQAREQLRLLSKITSRKAARDFVVFHFKESESSDVHQIEYIVDDMKKCIEIIKANYKVILASKSQKREQDKREEMSSTN